MISPKYALAVIILATIALIPVTIHTYLKSNVSDGKSVTEINRKLLSFYSRPTGRKPETIEKVFAAKDWIERNYITDSGKKILLFSARSFNYKKLYHHPEIALTGGLKISDRVLKKIPAFNGLQVHLILDRTGRNRGLIAYSLMVDNTFVGNPYIYQITSSWKALFRFTRPMTLFFVFDPLYSADTPVDKSIAVSLLNEAIKDFKSL